MVAVSIIVVPLHRNQIRIASYPALNSRRYKLNTFLQEPKNASSEPKSEKHPLELTTHKTHQGHSSGAGRCSPNPLSILNKF